MNNIGTRIKELRKKNDLTQERLAEYLGVTYKAVSKWECGLTAPDLSLILPLSRILRVSADELLGGKQNESDERYAEFDDRRNNFLKYDMKENYQTALQAVSQYPKDHKFLSWLARLEMSMAYHTEYKEDPSAPYSAKMLESSIKHNNIVIEECQDAEIRHEAIWNAMVCLKDMKRYDEALNYAKMLPAKTSYSREKAVELCLQGEELANYRKLGIYKKLLEFCASLSRIYWFAECKESCVMDALDTEEAVLQTIFPDGNYLGFHRNLCCAYQRRAGFEVVEGNYDKAVDYLKTMLEHAAKIPCGKHTFTCGILKNLSVDHPKNDPLPYFLIGLDDPNKPVTEQLKNRIMKLELFSPLWERQDFKTLFS